MWVDGDIRFKSLSQLLEHGRLNESPYSMIGPLFASPLWFLGKFFVDPEFWCISFNFIVFLLGGWIIYRFMGRYLDWQIARVFVILLFLASMFPEHIKNFYSEVFTSIAVAVGFLLIAQQKAVLGGICTSIGVANSPAHLFGLLLSTTRLVFEKRKLRYFLILVFGVSLIFMENWIRRGSVLVSGYEENHGYKTILPYSGLPGFSYPFVFGLLSILFSFGKGLIFYAPGIFLPVKKFLGNDHFFSKVQRYWLWYLAGLIMIYSKWWGWHGDAFWGPRFFLFASIPACLGLAVYWKYAESTRDLLITCGLLTFSFWIGLDSAVFGWGNLELCSSDPNFQHLCWYVPEFSALFRPFVQPKNLNPRDYFIFSVSVVTYSYLIYPILTKLKWKIVPLLQRSFQDWRI